MNLSKFSSTTLVIGLLSVVCAILFLGRWAGTGERYYVYLDWNLFLAWIPLWIAQFLTVQYQSRPVNTLGLCLGFAAWLLFFPNSPYLITDLIHLKNSPDHLIWYDALMHFVFALTGLLAGIYSMVLVHRLIRPLVGVKRSWVVMAGATVASSYGLFLGRVGRWNSWDIVNHPIALLKYAVIQLKNHQAIQLTVVFSVALLMSYIAFYLFLTRPKQFWR
jgi:uncharacterized membrane protein